MSEMAGKVLGDAIKGAQQIIGCLILVILLLVAVIAVILWKVIV